MYQLSNQPITEKILQVRAQWCNTSTAHYLMKIQKRTRTYIHSRSAYLSLWALRTKISLEGWGVGTKRSTICLLIHENKDYYGVQFTILRPKSECNI